MIQGLSILVALLATPTPMLVTGSDGQRADLRAHLAARPAVIIVMKSGACRVCIEQLQQLSLQRSELSRMDAAVVALNIDSAQSNAELERRVGVKVFADVDARLLQAVGLWISDARAAMPGAVFLNRCGEIESVLRGRRPGDNRTPVILKTLKRIARKQVCGTVI